MTLEELVREAQSLSIDERKRLIGLLIDTLTDPPPTKKRSLLELAGLGADVWKGVDPQEYIDQLRNEWDKRP